MIDKTIYFSHGTCFQPQAPIKPDRASSLQLGLADGPRLKNPHRCTHMYTEYPARGLGPPNPEQTRDHATVETETH